MKKIYGYVGVAGIIVLIITMSSWLSYSNYQSYYISGAPAPGSLRIHPLPPRDYQGATVKIQLDANRPVTILIIDSNAYANGFSYYMDNYIYIKNNIIVDTHIYISPSDADLYYIMYRSPTQPDNYISYTLRISVKHSISSLYSVSPAPVSVWFLSLVCMAILVFMAFWNQTIHEYSINKPYTTYNSIPQNTQVMQQNIVHSNYYCHLCGIELPQGSSFCNRCGRGI
jgi:hypothetical protein